jgi:hypothetical protein
VATVSALVEYALDWLRRDHPRFRFVAERDVVWALQRRLHDEAGGRPATGLRSAPGAALGRRLQTLADAG